MNNKEVIKYFYEVVVSKNLLDELPQYISEDCVQKVDKNEIFIGINGMRKHLEAVKKHIRTTQWKLSVNLRTAKLLFQNLL